MLAPSDSPKTNPTFFQGLQYPLLISPKLDGIRCVTREVEDIEYDGDLNEVPTGNLKNKCLSKTLIELPSRQVQEMFADCTFLDGELTVGPPTAFGVYNLTQSHVMSGDKPHPDLQFNVFDCVDDELSWFTFEERFEHTKQLVSAYRRAYGVKLEVVEHTIVTCYEELTEKENEMLALGYEGAMLRNPFGRYKYGRGTYLEGLNYKLKRSMDAEFMIHGFEEGFTNTNTTVTSATGYAKKSSAKEGLVPSGTLGKFLSEYMGSLMKIAPGAFTHPERQYIWNNQEQFRGKYLKARYFGHGMKDLPRHPRALGWRDKMDM